MTDVRVSGERDENLDWGLGDYGISTSRKRKAYDSDYYNLGALFFPFVVDLGLHLRPRHNRPRQIRPQALPWHGTRGLRPSLWHHRLW